MSSVSGEHEVTLRHAAAGCVDGDDELDERKRVHRGDLTRTDPLGESCRDEQVTQRRRVDETGAQLDAGDRQLGERGGHLAVNAAEVVGCVDVRADRGHQHGTLDVRARCGTGCGEPLSPDGCDVLESEPAEHHDERVHLGERRLKDSLIVRVACRRVDTLGTEQAHGGRRRRPDLTTLLLQPPGEGPPERSVGSVHEDRHPDSDSTSRADRTARHDREDRRGTSLRGRMEAMVGRPRHTDLELLELARDGSAPAFASLLHRHREVLHRGALRAEHPERAVESALLAAIRQLRRDAVPTEDLRGWLVTLVEEQVERDRGRPGVERMLPGDWFDRQWARAERHWPSGRRLPEPPRWAAQLAGAVLLAAVGAGGTYLVVTSDVTTEVIRELIAEPVDDPDVVVVPGPVVEVPLEEAPELFGDVELGELPTYDLTGEAGREGTSGPTLAPPRGGDAAADGGVADDGPDNGGPVQNGTGPTGD